MGKVMPKLIHIHPDDNVVVAIDALEAGDTVEVSGRRLVLRADVPAGHKIALKPIGEGEAVVKYGHRIGLASEAVEPGAWVHSHNLKTALKPGESYVYEPVSRDAVSREVPTFMGYRRPSGRVATRNEIWVINTVGCVNRSAERIARMANERFAGRIDGVHAFAHPYGCSQLGDDLTNTQKILASLIRHPNAGGVLVLGLGCENNRLETLLEMAGDVDRERIRYFSSQMVLDEVEEGVDAVEELVRVIEHDERVPCPASDLVIGMKCGGSDGFSGISANPLVGRITDRLAAVNGTPLLTEVPEMFGAEQQLMNRAADEGVYRSIVDMIERFKDYFIAHNQPIYENPSPGNKDGGLTTLEEKSLGAIQKGGTGDHRAGSRVRRRDAAERTRADLCTRERRCVGYGRNRSGCYPRSFHHGPRHAARLPCADAENLVEHRHCRAQAALDRLQRRRAARWYVGYGNAGRSTLRTDP